MGRKKKKPMKPWCWYCNREFDDEKILIQHQKAKHFKCHICHKKLYTGPGLAIHCMQVHKENIDKVPNALPGRHDIEIEIYGMEGIPDKDLQEHAAKANEQKRKEKEMEQGGASDDQGPSTGMPPMNVPPGMPPMGMPPGAPGMPRGMQPGMQQRMPGMPSGAPGMPGFPGMPPMMPGMPMPPGMPVPPGMPPFPMPPMGMPGMPPMPQVCSHPGLVCRVCQVCQPQQHREHRRRQPVQLQVNHLQQQQQGLQGRPAQLKCQSHCSQVQHRFYENQIYHIAGLNLISSKYSCVSNLEKGISVDVHVLQLHQLSFVLALLEHPSTASSGPVGADFRPLASQARTAGPGVPGDHSIGPVKPTFPAAAYSAAPTTTSAAASAASKPTSAGGDSGSTSSATKSGSSTVTSSIKSGPSTSSTSKIIHPDEEMSLEELRASMSKYKKAPPSSSTIPGVSQAPRMQQQQQQPQVQPRMAGNMMAGMQGMGPPGRMPQQQGGMGMQMQGQMQGQMGQRMGMAAQGAMQMNGQRMPQFQMGQMPGYGMPPHHGMPGMNYPGGPHPGMMGGMPQRMPPQMGDGRPPMMQGGRY
ncbi:uncharacterized protein [Amphiura filiformis]|uniref:uncharacterized protein n=1 Tax=Amphiura filiformis TaxID=82378 RepID=UPI003B2111CA